MIRSLLRNSSASLAALAVCALPSYGQTAGADLLVPLPGQPTPSGIRGLAVGDFNGDLVPDVASIWDDHPTVVPSADLFDNAYQISSRQVSDVATLPATEPMTEDGLLAAGPDGLHLYRRGAATPDFVETAIDELTWAGVTSLAVGDLDHDGTADVLGLNGTSVLRLEGKPGAWMTRPAVPVAAGARRIGLLDYDGDATLEVYLVRDDQVEVVDLAGAARLTVNEPEVEDAIPVRHVADAASGRRRLAVLFESYAPTSNRWLRTYGDGGVAVGTPLGPTLGARLGAANLFPLTCPGHRDDLIVSHAGHVLQIGLLNVSTLTASSEPFDNALGDAKAVADWGTPVTPHQTAPAVFDLDLDGDPDWYQPYEGLGDLWLDRNPEVNEEVRKVYPAGTTSSIDDDDVLTLEFKRPVPGLAGATHVEFVVYHRGVDGYGDPLPFASSTPDVYYIELAAAPAGHLTLELQLHESTYPNEAEYYIAARELEVGAGGTYLTSGVPGLTIWSADEARYLEVRNGYQQITGEDGTSSETDGPPKSGGVETGGGSSTNIPICPFDPNMIPDPPRDMGDP